MSSLVRWILIGSIFLGLIIMIVSYLITRKRIKKLTYDTLLKNQKYNKIFKNNAVLQRGDSHGKLLWDLRDKTKNALDDFQMECIINTLIRNDYKKTYVVNKNNYIETSIVKLANQKISDQKPDAIILENQKNINDLFDRYYKKLNSHGIIFIINVSRRNREIKKLLSYTKLANIRREIVKIGKGLLLIVK